MASIRKRGESWEAFVAKNGTRKSATFATKSQAQQWAIRIEAELQETGKVAIPNKTFGQLLLKYAEDVSPTKKGARWESVRIQAIQADPLADVRLPDLDAKHFAEWRDRRLKVVSAGTVLRDWNLLSSACNKALHEWQWLKHNPMSRVKRPAEVPPRDRLLTQDEIDRLTHAMGEDIETVSGRVCLAMHFALETGMRTGEIAGLIWDDVFTDKKFCRVQEGKTRSAKRDVPISIAAIAIIEKLRHWDRSVFDLNPSQIGSMFRKAMKKAAVTGIHFHDTRANAITMLSTKVGILDLARIIGHKDLSMLQVYYRKSATDIAGDLD